MNNVQNSGMKLIIETPEALTNFIKGAVRSGYMHQFDLREVAHWINTVDYPIYIPVNFYPAIDLGGNPIIRSLFGSGIEKTLTKYLKQAMDTNSVH